jgi:hypothetical protein
MLDGLSVGDMMVIAAMGITSDGHKLFRLHLLSLGRISIITGIDSLKMT